MATEINLAQALKLKNRRVRKMQELQRLAMAHNVRLAANEPKFDVTQAIEDLKSETEKLIALKTAIDKANEPARDKIYRLAELRGRVNFWRGLDVREGVQEANWGQTEPQVYVSQIDSIRQQREVEETEAEIDRLQDELDQFNATTKIEVDD